MLRKTLPIAVLCAAPVLLAFAPQKRASEKKVLTFAERIANSNKAWEGKKYSTCMNELSEAITLCRVQQRAIILASLPPAPAGWTIKPQNKNADRDAAAAMAMLGGLGGAAPIEQTYTEDEGNGRMVVTVMVNSPMIQMMAMMFSNPAMLGDGQELIEYDADKAILTKKSNGAELQIKIGPKDMVTGTVRNKDDVFLLKQFNQQVVNNMKAALDQ